MILFGLLLEKAVCMGKTVSHWASLADDFNQHPFFAPTIKLAVKNLFPRTEVKLACRDGDDCFTSHYLMFDVRIGVVFTCIIVAIGGNRLMGCHAFEKHLKIVMQTRFVVIDEYRSGNVHGVYQRQTIMNTTFFHTGG